MVRGAWWPWIVVGWGLAVLASSKLLLDYKGRPAAAGAVSARWPSSLAHDRDRPTLLMLVHPRCPCTQASISELARLHEQLGDRARMIALVVVPPGASKGFDEGLALDRLHAIPGVQVTIDQDGREAQRFGATTSGQVLLYDRDGTLRFDGGITPGRGHEGDSVGRRSIVSLVTGSNDAQAHSPVFGCSLLDPDAKTNHPRSTQEKAP